MKKHLLMLFVAMIAATMSLKAQVILIDDGFENGIQDSVWTQEFVRGNHPWAVEGIEDNPQWPATIWQGTKRAYLRNTSGETEGYVTRLVSKVMDLRPELVYQPELTFWYANPKWTADRDTLRVLYKTSANGNWKQLAEFSTASASWQKIKLELPEVNATYQIAFEGTDNLGRGIVLDSVKLRSAPECTVPHDITINNKGAGLVNIAWNASWDANFYELVVSKNLINPDTVNLIPDSLGIVAYHGMVNGLQQNYDVTLVSGEYYYVYLRSICETETSTWNSEDPNQGQYRFRVKATKNIPYAEGFNMPYESLTLRRDLEWTWGNNTGNYNPFINVGVTLENRPNYSHSGTSCIVFSGTTTNEPAAAAAVPANKYVYLATPALADTLNPNFALNQCYVRFWSTVYTFVGRSFAHALIVGAMTDPEDITTFVPVDTVSVWGYKQFQENVVDFSSYQGEGSYVAFVSAFDTRNIFYLDDISIEYNNKSLQVPTEIKVNPRSTSADITWKGNSPAYNVMITNEEVDPAKVTASQIVAQTQVTTNSFNTEALEADHSWNTPYYVYVQGVNGSEVSAWSYRYPFVTIAAQKAIPYSFDFEQKSGVYTIGETATMYPKEIGIFSNDPEYPHMVTSTVHSGSSSLHLTKDWGNDSWITLPMIADSLKNIQVKFYLSGSTTPTQVNITVGVMTNPMDINTFIPVSDCKLASSGYTICYANFLNYTGPEGIIALVWSDVEGGKQTIGYIDDLTVEAIAQCLPPVNIVTDAESDSVTISWDKSIATSWEFVLASKQLTAANLKDSLANIALLENVLFADTLVWEDVLTNPTFGFDSLNYNTSYYLYVRTQCGDETTWWVESSFTTPCPDDFPIPFFENFESYSTGAYDDGFACWQAANYGTGTGYPKILKPTSGAQSGNMLELWSTSTTQRNLVMLPGLDGDLSQMLLSFNARSYGTTTKSVLYVGSMADIRDWTSFVAMDTIYMDGGNEFTVVRMDLANYHLAYNNIVFTSGLGNTLEMASDIYIDDVSIKPNTCIDAWNVEATDIQTNSIDIKWDGKATGDEWIVKVMQDTTVVIADTTIVGKAFHAEGLEPVMLYTFYIQPSCDTTWVSASFRSACVKLDPTKPNKEDFESITDATTSYKATSQIPCWTVGNANPSASTSYIPFVYKSATQASSGNNTYRAYGYSTTSSPAYIATPEIDCQSMTELAVTFNIYATTSYWWICGVMSDPTDLSTFVALDSVKGVGSSVQYTYDLSEYEGVIPATAKYFAWRGRYGVTDYLYLDDVSVTKITCPLTKPTYSGLTASDVNINSGLRTNNQWILLITTQAFTPDQLATANVDSLVNDSVIMASGIVAYYDTISDRIAEIYGVLEEQTDYYVATATLCEDGISQWATTSFKTPCKAITPEALGTITFSKKDGYVAGSSATRYMPCWTVGNKNVSSATSTYIPYVCTTSTYLYSAQKDSVLRLYTYNSSSATNDGAYAIMPELAVDDISKYQVNFYARSNTSASYNNQLIIGIVSDPSDLNTFVVTDTLTLNKNAYEPFTVTFEDYQGDYLGNKGRYIMFLNEFGFMGYTDAYVAAISVEKIPTCRPVTEFSVDSVSEDAAMISWKQYSDSYRMMLADEEVSEAEKATYAWLLDTLVTKTDSVLITGLKPAAQYYVYAQAMCEGGDSSAISMAYAFITTTCPENGFAVPYKQDFEKYATNAKVVDCWQFEDYAASTKTYPEVMNPTSGAVSGKQLELWSSTTTHRCVAIMPKIQGNLADYMLSFDARSYSVSTKSVLYIGTMDDVLDSAAGFAPFDTLYMDGGNEFYHKDLILAEYAEKLVHSRIAFSSGLAETLEMASDMYLDNVKIGMPPSCFAPTLEAGNSSMTSATILITPAKETNDKWQLAVVADSIYTAADFDLEAYIDTTASVLYMADTVEYEITGLEPGTVYQVFGRTVCGGEDGNSEWTNFPTKVRTKYYFQDSYYFGFEKSEGWDFCQGSTSTTYWINPAIEVGYNGGTATTSYTSYYPYCMGNTTSSIYAYGPREAESPKNAALRWQATSTYWGGYAIFPAVAEAHDRSFEFKMRCGYGSYNSTKDTIGISTNYACKVEVGTIDKNKGFETYQVIATIDQPAIPKVKGGLTEANDWFWTHITIDLDSATVANKQMVIRMPKPEDSNSRYIHFDDVTLGASKGFGLVSFDKIHAEAKKATVTWENLGGPWNLYILKANGDTLTKFENLSDVTSQEITGLQPQTSYTAILVAASAPEDTKFKTAATREFRTPCLPVQPNEMGEFVWDFNDKNEWERSDIQVGGNTITDTAYYKPGCFTVGTTYTGSITTSTIYYNWLIQRKGYTYTGAPTTLGTTATSTLHYEYGRGDSPALRVYSSSSYMTPYIVLPELNCDLDTMMIEFWGRCLANYDDTYGTVASRNKMVSASYCGGNYSQSMVVGTLTDPKDFSTLEVIDTLTYTAYTSTTAGMVTDDPTGNRYWQKFQLPLAGTSGKYIVLFQPAYGLFFLDDLKVTAVGDNLFAPSGANTGVVTDTSATFNWIVKHPNIQTVVVVTNQEGNAEVLRDTIAGNIMTYTVDTLKPATGYQWYVYQTNGEVNTSSTPSQKFFTECVAIHPDYTNGFELNDGWKVLPAQTSETYKQTICWTYENAGSGAVGTNAYNIANGTSLYSHSGVYAAKIYAYSTTQQNYLAMPAMDDLNAFDTLQINFWMRPTYVTASTMKPYSTYLGATYSKAVIVGTMTDPMDATTFVPIDTINYTYPDAANAVASEANDYLFQKCKVALTGAQGKYVAFMATLYAKGDSKKYTNCYMYIDDVSFSPIQHCEAPVELTSSEISATAATLSWEAPEGASEYILQVSTDYTYTEDTAFVFNDTINTNTYTLTNLKAYTEYVWRVSTICEADLGESDFSPNAVFTTARQPFFVETFGAANLDADWTFATNPALLVIDSTNVELEGANNTSYGWRRVTTDAGLEGAHYAVVFYSSSSATTTDYDYYWLISPVITLDETVLAHLTFDLAFTGCSASTTPNALPATEAQMADDYTFMILISEDGGKTWNKENILGIWNNTLPAGHQLRDLPYAPTNLRYDLAKYAGKNIRIAFYREADTYKGTTPYTCAVHLDNIRINNYDVIEDDAQACQYEDIDKLGFHIDGDIAAAGDTIYRRLEKAYDFNANTKGYRDSIYVLNVEYYKVEESIITDTICEGESYTDENFTGKDRTGVYRRKLQSVLSCDSLVTLNLHVTPRAYAEDEIVSICPSETYTWNGVVYDRAGLFRDTLVSAAGCDSIMTLVLSYYGEEDTIYDAVKVDLAELPFTYENAEHPYISGQTAISYAAGTAKGVYVDTVYVLGENCTAVLVLTTEVYDKHEGIDNVEFGEGAHKLIYRDNLYIICNDEWYNAEGKKVGDPRK